MRAEDRTALVLGLRVGGAVLVVLGLWQWLGGSVAGAYGFGTILVVAGIAGAVVLPLLLGRWR